MCIEVAEEGVAWHATGASYQTVLSACMAQQMTRQLKENDRLGWLEKWLVQQGDAWTSLEYGHVLHDGMWLDGIT